MADVAKLKALLGRLIGFRDSLPTEWRTFPARYAEEYEAILRDLASAGLDVGALALPANAVTRRPLISNYETRGRTWSNPEIDSTVLRSRIGGAIATVEHVLDQFSERAPAPSPLAGLGAVTFSNSTVNLGTIHGDMRTSIQVIQDRGQEQLARLLADLVAQIAASRLSAPEKDDATQLAGTLAREVAAQPAGKLSAAVRPVASALGSILTRSAELVQIWQAIQPFFT